VGDTAGLHGGGVTGEGWLRCGMPHGGGALL
jgi:hypothetical protein